MDISTLIGFVIALFSLLFSIHHTAGEKWYVFVSPGEMLIVFGTTIGALFVTFKLNDVFAAFKAALRIFIAPKEDPEGTIGQIVKCAEVARKDGILALEPIAQQVTDPFLSQGLRLAIDGTDPDSIETILQNKLDSMEVRHNRSKFFYEVAGRACPTFAMCGTLIGIIFMLQSLEDPKKIGTGLGAAMVATLYGAVGANLLFLPIAEKLKNQHGDEMLSRKIIIQGIVSIQAGDNPGIVEEKLMTFLVAKKKAAA